MAKKEITAALLGNPNVGKSTLFNSLTGMKQHTGNWAGKTVAHAVGYHKSGDTAIKLVDLPGTYSLTARSPEEKIARDYILSGEADCIIAVVDSSCVERSMNLVLQAMELTDRVIVCLNLIDEADKGNIVIDSKLLSERFGVPFIKCCARGGQGVCELVSEAVGMSHREAERKAFDLYTVDGKSEEELALIRCESAKKLVSGAVVYPEKTAARRRLDLFLTGRVTGLLSSAVLLILVFYLTITGANYPSALLHNALGSLGDILRGFAVSLGAAEWLVGFLFDGVYLTTAWVVSVMLPPMAIFFPLFTLLEDFGYLPRVAFNLDRLFKGCNACGKQSLTMMMGLGCNACGVTGCRIIDSPRERKIAILTNAFMPCNGRFPALILICTAFFAGGFGGALTSAVMLASVIIIGSLATLAVSWMLSKTVLAGSASFFTLELPPYRRPQIMRVIVRSIFDRTLFVLGRAVAVAAPAGAVIWILSNTAASSYLYSFISALDGIGRFCGLDGVILMAFILGIPANEIVLPIILALYTQSPTLVEAAGGGELTSLLYANGWTSLTAVCFILFSLMHFPCATTLWTIQKETGSFKMTLASFLIPTVFGFVVCAAVAQTARLFM